MIYNFNLGIGWASSGVEYAQAYRAQVLRNIGQEAKFIFTDMFATENIEHMTKNIGFNDEEVIWLYTFFTDVKISPVTYTLKMLENSIEDNNYTFSRNGKVAKYTFGGVGNFITAYMVNDKDDTVHRVEIVSENKLIRKDFYTYCRTYTEYYAPLNGTAHLYNRRYFNEDGSVAYEEIIDGDNAMYKFPDRLIWAKEDLVAYMVERMNITEDDIVIIDRTTGVGQAIMQNASKANIGIVIHADHFSEGSTDDNNILWNNYYEYAFSQYKKVDFFITSTYDQQKLIEEQFEKYVGEKPVVITIPVGALSELKYPEGLRKKNSLITASRLATEKHVDWLVSAVVEARKEIPDITLDIYGKGGEEGKIKQLIKDNNAEEYIRLMGHKNLAEIYKDYDAYFSASMSEGFGLTLMEAIGSGLPIIGFDVRYGNMNFIDEGKNGYKIPVHSRMNNKERVSLLKDRVVKMLTEDDMEAFHKYSYQKAEEYLEKEVENKWAELLKMMK